MATATLNFSIIRGETFYASFWQDKPTSVTETFTATSGQNTITLTDPPVVISKKLKKYLCEVYVNGTLLDNISLEGNVVYLVSPLDAGNAIVVIYRKQALVSFTGATARMDIRNRATGALVHSLTTENDGIILTSPGKVDLLIPAADTALFDLGSFGYDLEIRFPTLHKVAIKGKFTVKKNETEQ